MNDVATCTHSRTEPRKQTKTNGAVCVVMQCLDCGRRLNEISKAGHDLAKLSDFDAAANEQRYHSDVAAQLAASDQEREQRSVEWWQRYNEYLKSDHWRSIRAIVLNRDRACMVCFKKYAEQAHHLTYASFNKWGVSFPNECVGVCAECHENLHIEQT